MQVVECMQATSLRAALVWLSFIIDVSAYSSLSLVSMIFMSVDWINGMSHNVWSVLTAPFKDFRPKNVNSVDLRQDWECLLQL